MYLPPHTQLGTLMVAARRRGLSFEDFWTEAIREGEPLVMVTHSSPPAGAVRWPTDRNDRVTWLGAILDAKEGWRRAYDREQPTASERALLYLGDEIGALAVVAERRQHEEELHGLLVA